MLFFINLFLQFSLIYFLLYLFIDNVFKYYYLLFTQVASLLLVLSICHITTSILGYVTLVLTCHLFVSNISYKLLLSVVNTDIK